MHRKRICCNNTEKIIYQHFNEQYSKYNTSSRFLEKNLVLPQTIFFYTQVPAIIDAATPRSLPNSHLKNLERPLLFFRRYIVSLL
jgi:hypothetical protein